MTSMERERSRESAELKEIVYGIDLLTGLAVFAPRDEAESLQRIFDALGASSWGEVRAILTPDEVEEVRSQYDEEHENDENYSPPDDVPFDYHLTGFDDGWWPIPSMFRMLDWMPGDVASQYGRVESTPNGDYLAIEAGSLNLVADELGARGYTCTRDDALVWNRR
jgi:hypothetical protein